MKQKLDWSLNEMTWNGKLCEYVSIYVYIYIQYIYIYIYIYTHTHTHTYIHTIHISGMWWYFKEEECFICHIHNYTEYNSSEICALNLTHPSTHTPGALGSQRCGARGAVGVRCLAQGSHLIRGQFLLEPRFKPTTLGYKSDALSIRHTYTGI